MKYKINNTKALVEPSRELFYWLGFIAADGYIASKQSIFGIGLNKDDYGHLEKFLSFIGSNHPIIYKEKTNSCSFRICDKGICNILELWGIHPRKSFDTYNLMYKIPNEYKDCFISGLFDGDGSVFNCIVKHKYKEKIYEPKKYAGVNITTNEETALSIIEHLKNFHNFKKLSFTRDRTICKIGWWSTHDIQRFYDIYIKSPIHLDRKVVKYNTIIKDIATQEK